MSKPSDFPDTKTIRLYDVGYYLEGGDYSLAHIHFEQFKGRSKCYFATNHLSWMLGKEELYCLRWLKDRQAKVEISYEGPEQAEEDNEPHHINKPEDLFTSPIPIDRKNYKRSWIGLNYLIKCGKYKGHRVSEVDSEPWLIFWLNRFEGQFEQDLYRCLVDQLNSLHL